MSWPPRAVEASAFDAVLSPSPGKSPIRRRCPVCEPAEDPRPPDRYRLAEGSRSGHGGVCRLGGHGAAGSWIERTSAPIASSTSRPLAVARRHPARPRPRGGPRLVRFLEVDAFAGPLRRPADGGAAGDYARRMRRPPRPRAHVQETEAESPFCAGAYRGTAPRPLDSGLQERERRATPSAGGSPRLRRRGILDSGADPARCHGCSAAGVNTGLHTEASDYGVKPGDLMKSDCGGLYQRLLFQHRPHRNGSSAPLTEESHSVWTRLREIQHALVDMLRPGRTGREVYEACEKLHAERDLPFIFGHNGHSVGIHDPRAPDHRAARGHPLRGRHGFHGGDARQVARAASATTWKTCSSSPRVRRSSSPTPSTTRRSSSCDGRPSRERQPAGAGLANRLDADVDTSRRPVAIEGHRRTASRPKATGPQTLGDWPPSTLIAVPVI